MNYLKLLIKPLQVIGCGLFIFVFYGATVQAANLTVNSSADTKANDGSCTFTEAVTSANGDVASGGAAGECIAGSGADTINFNISGTADYSVNGQSGYTINLTTELDLISDQVFINGYTQPGALANTNPVGQPFNGTVLIKLTGVTFSNPALLSINTDNVEIRGLAINDTDTGISITGDNSIIAGNIIGLNPDGSLGNGIGLGGISVQLSNNGIIGGSLPADRNVVTNGSNSNFSVPNIFFTSDDGTPYADNVIQGNYIGSNLNGQFDASIANGQGIVMNGFGNDSLIGGINPQEGNIIIGNKGAGISLVRLVIPMLSADLSPQNVSILGNSISKTAVAPNLDNTSLGINIFRGEDTDNDITTDTFYETAPNANDLSDIDSGPNNKINFPVLNSISQSGNQATFNFDLDAAGSPTNQYRIELFSNDSASYSGYGEGQTFLGATTVTNGDNQQDSITLPAGFEIAGTYLSATTTALDSTTSSGFGSTSEFSLAIQPSLAATDSTSSAPSNSLANTGQDSQLLIVTATVILLSSAVFVCKVRLLSL